MFRLYYYYVYTCKDNLECAKHTDVPNTKVWGWWTWEITIFGLIDRLWLSHFSTLRSGITIEQVIKFHRDIQNMIIECMGSLYLNFQGIEGYLGYKIPVFFKFISLSAIKHLRYGSTPALWTLRWVPEYLYSYITINIRVWSPARPAQDVFSTDLSVKMQPHKFANGIAFAAGHINWFWYLENVEGVYLMPAQFYFKQFCEVEGNLWVKGFLRFVWKRKHCSNHVFNTSPCLQFVPLLRWV